MKKSFRLIASLFMLLVVAIALTACSNKKYEQAMTNVSLLLDTTWDQNERLDDNNNSLGSFVNSDFTVPYEINVDGEIIGVSYEISGTGAAVVKNDSAKTVTIDVTQTGEAQKFTLTVTIEKVDPRSWEFNVDALDLSMEKTQAEIDAMNPMTYEEYAAAESGDAIVIQGYITHPHDYSSSYAQGSVWLQDDNGGYYAYRVKVNSQREWDTYFKEGNKIAFLADNENAKTVLFQILAGELEPDAGTVTWGTTITSNYFPKDNNYLFESDLSITDWLRQYSKDPDETYVRSFLGRMLFSGEEALKKVNVLSGGEKVRCVLSKMMLSGANLLIFDEPTNHLDMESITALNEGMKRFNGIILFTSHDHQLTQTVANRIIDIKQDKLVDRETTYDEYLEETNN